MPHGRPLQRRRRRGQGDRRHRPGARAPERPRALRVAQPRPRRARRSRTPRPGAIRFDYFHVNSIDVDADGNLLVSARNTWAVYKIDRRERRGDLAARRQAQRLRDGPRARRSRGSTTRATTAATGVTLFDNGGRAPGGAAVARARDLARLRSEAGDTRSAVRPPPEPARLAFMGNAQVLPNGHVVVGWGNEPYLTEFDAGRDVLFDAKLPRGGQNYRAFRFDWTGSPSTDPSSRLRAGGTAGRRTRAGTGRHGSPPGVFVPAAPRGRCRRSARRASAASRLRSRCRHGPRFADVVAIDHRDRELGRSKTIRI